MNTEELIKQIVGACYQVHMALSPGYLESVYQKALLQELSLRHIRAKAEIPLTVEYKGVTVGDFRADIIVEDCVIIELKAVSQLSVQHEIQLINYLNCCNFNTGILVNFGSDKIEIKRKFKERLTPKDL